jgi:polar amino acid transport system substrate-binding protein
MPFITGLEAGPINSQNTLPDKGERITPGNSPILNEIGKSGRIIVGVQRDYIPFHIENPEEGYPGIDVEIAELLAQALGVKIDIRFYPLTELIRRTGTGEIHIAFGGISSNLERARVVSFSEPYLITSPAAIVSRSSLPPESESETFERRRIRSVADLKFLGRLRIGVMGNTTHEALLRSEPDFSGNEIKPFDSRERLVQALNASEIDAIFADEIFIRSAIQKRLFSSVRFLPLLEHYREEHICILLSKTDPELELFTNFFLRELKRTGQLTRIIERYTLSNRWVGGDG